MKPLKDCHVLVTATSFGRADPCLRSELEAAVGRVTYNPVGKPLTSAQLADLLTQVDGCIAGLDAFDAAALRRADCLRVIARYGVGTDNVDLDAARAQSIIVTNTPTANAVSVAELTIALMLNLARPILVAAEATRRGEWPRTTGLLLEGKTVGLVGLGAIGKQVARRLAAFDCRILAHDVTVDATFAAAHGVTIVPLETVLSEADFVSLHVPLLPSTRRMVDATFLHAMKPGAFLVNTSRGELIDEDALCDALRGGHLRGAALDVFEREPPGVDHPLACLPQVIATPHMGAHSDGAMNAMGRLSLDDCLAVLRGDSPRYRVV